MRVLHTSDWHIGAELFGRSRLEDQRAFLAHLCDVLETRKVDVLLVSGDIFDTTSPSNRAVTLFFDFLHDLRKTGCRHAVITGGNHDSPSQLAAPSSYLSRDRIHVIGCAEAGNLDKEVIVVPGDPGNPALVICAVPFLRDRDVRRAAFGMDQSERDRALARGIHEHYAQVQAHAMEKMRGFAAPCPLIGMGHLFAAGASAQDGETTLTVGTLGAVNAAPFQELFAYTALGHIHKPQKAAGELVRYSGSPLAMSFGERGTKKLLLLDFADGTHEPAAWPVDVEELDIPRFRSLVELKGGVDEILDGLEKTAQDAQGAQATFEPWVAVDYTGQGPLGAGHDAIRERAADLHLEVVRVRDLSAQKQSVFEERTADRELSEYTPKDIFNLCLESRNVEEDRRALLNELFEEICASLDELDEDREGPAPAPDTSIGISGESSGETSIETSTETSIDASPVPEEESAAEGGADADSRPSS